MKLKSKYKKLKLLTQSLQKNPFLLKKAFLILRQEGFRNTLIKTKQYLNNKNTQQLSFSTMENFQRLPLCSKEIKNSLDIAIVTHIFYIDLLEEIVQYIENISTKPMLFISIAKDVDSKEVEVFLDTKGFFKRKIVKVQNKGRDIAPFLIEFAQELQQFDLVCKVHGKKSLYTGSAQDEWRNHLCSNLLGSQQIVNDIISKFNTDQKLGMVFGDNYAMIPYWGYTWLTNKQQVSLLLEKLQLNELSSLLHKTYIDYPAGSMFWFRPDAIKQILNGDFKYDDFPEEPIANDGTIAHAIERLFGYVTRFNNYSFIELNYARELYTENFCHKNFNQLEAKTLAVAKEIVAAKEYVVFDIFDTLITRGIYAPDNIFRIIEHKVDKEFGFKSNFFEVRKNVESILQSKYRNTKDVSYDDIYANMQSNSKYTAQIVDYLEKLEFQLELRILEVKKDSIELLNFAKEKKKKILFVSDMYLGKEQIKTILQKLDIDLEGVNLMVSSDTGFRKDNGSFWKHLTQDGIINPHKSIVFGDNEVSDVKISGDFGIDTFHIFSEKNCFLESPLGKSFHQKFHNISEKNMLLFGPILPYVFNSAFDLKNSVLAFNKKLSPYEFGYIALAPFITLFMANLYKKHKDKRIFFVARDGYFLKEIFEHFLQSKGLQTKEKQKYLLTSRRAIFGAAVKNEENLKNMILNHINFSGSFSQLIFSRMGVGIDFLTHCKISDFQIHNKKGLEKAYALLVQNIDTLNEYTSLEHERYMHYLDEIGFLDKTYDDVIVDIGYSGTIQKHLYDLCDKKIFGEYFVTTQKVKDIESKDNKLSGYFGDKISLEYYENIINKYSLVLEAYLTSDKGQFLFFDADNTPVYKTDSNPITIQKEITNGIKDYITALDMVDFDFFEESDALKEISLFHFEYILKNRNIDQRLQEIFYIEDDFTGQKKLNILDILTQRGI